ncbi:MAG: hypothetical protein ACR2H5_25375 [Ktedonobacteraceae bacterium]
MMPVNILVEGVTDEPVAKKLLKHVGLDVGKVYGRRGKAHLLERSVLYNKAAHFEPWFVLVDLDQDAQCPSQAILGWMPQPSRGMRFRVVVRSIEAWLLADRENMARFLSVNLSKIPPQIDVDPDPKRTLINIARTSRKGSIREDIVPQQSSGARVGPLYVARLTDFVENYWEPAKGAGQSESLRRCISALSTLTSFGN